MEDKVKYLLENLEMLADESLDAQEIERLRAFHQKKLERYASEEKVLAPVVDLKSKRKLD